MAGDERLLVEAPALEQLKGLGWQHLDGTTQHPEQTEKSCKPYSPCIDYSVSAPSYSRDDFGDSPDGSSEDEHADANASAGVGAGSSEDEQDAGAGVVVVTVVD